MYNLRDGLVKQKRSIYRGAFTFWNIKNGDGNTVNVGQLLTLQTRLNTLSNKNEIFLVSCANCNPLIKASYQVVKCSHGSF